MAVSMPSLIPPVIEAMIELLCVTWPGGILLRARMMKCYTYTGAFWQALAGENSALPLLCVVVKEY